MAESRSGSFKRIAENRTNELIRRIRILGNCSNRSCHAYSEQQVKKYLMLLNPN